MYSHSTVGILRLVLVSTSLRMLKKVVQQDHRRAIKENPSELARLRYLTMAQLSSPLRASNEGILRPRVARAQGGFTGPSDPLLADFLSILLLLCTADAGIIPSMRHTWTLIGLLAGLCLIGATTTQLIPAATEAGRIGWMLYLLAFPIALAGLVRIGWTWTAMACVIYGTVGLALDLATVTSILGGKGEPGALFLFSAMSGIVNFLLILFGGRAFLHSFQETALPGSHPPSPPSPSSSARP